MFLCSDCLIPIPRGEFKKRMEKEDPLAFSIRTNKTAGSGLEILDREVHAAGVIENIAIILPLTNRLMENIDIPTSDHSFERMEDLYKKMGLTAQETEILDMRLDGLTYEEIGVVLGMSYQAVRDYHMQNIKGKLVRLGIKMPNHAPLITGKKICTKCQNELSLSFFYKIGQDSYKSVCKNCMKQAYTEKRKAKPQESLNES